MQKLVLLGRKGEKQRIACIWIARLILNCIGFPLDMISSFLPRIPMSRAAQNWSEATPEPEARKHEMLSRQNCDRSQFFLVADFADPGYVEPIPLQAPQLGKKHPCTSL